jgi:hypothetical protein
MPVGQWPNWPEVLALIDSDRGSEHPKWAAQKIAGLMGLPYLGSGRHRVVLDLGAAALKVALNKRGLREIHRESVLYFSLPRADRVHLATCLGTGHGWAVFERLIPMSYQYGYREYRLRMQQIRNEIRRLGITDISSPRNWGIREDWGPVVLDYSLHTAPSPTPGPTSASTSVSRQPRVWSGSMNHNAGRHREQAGKRHFLKR